ncbi:DUF6531 domain-containing protein [Pseudomonas sp. ZM23]|uniref:DUF6531 domain-containing protein n=1 Tax=Pseudomonas triclosanedens TaxID=2961893 RepID=A0ABY6ZYT2_9PSED|nr:DUF6531 domain-containing protein [Pseudomonas triclosanedens]MCP8467468.1 DUF6531 domain-containing protein [Pseudomonas triclosanedens]MCP8469832.1 DUF6531 domain-containing protein [Pseudomonas triclosanedens]MCP8478857.1 DUF6531 domain-containing protein [Pseudomonas triclosanedens]WAI49165.1 DUF6531 domain-containing protein [Pseudomonas triclosanedens]
MKKNRLPLLLTATFLATGGASAEDYYWRSTANTEITGSTPEEVCWNFFTWYKAYYSYDKRFNIVYKGSEYRGPDHSALCFVGVYEIGRPQVGAYTSYSTRDGAGCSLDKKYNPTKGGCTRDEQKGIPDSKSCAANPINIAIGNKFQIETDYRSENSPSLNFSRTYNSLDGIWRHNFSTHLRLTNFGSLALVQPDGKESFFTITGDNISAQSNNSGTLLKSGSNWIYRSSRSGEIIFNESGRMTHWIDPTGNKYEITYSDDKVTIQDQTGNSLIYTEDPNHQPLSMQAGSFKASYTYGTEDRLINRLLSVTRTLGGNHSLRNYHYSDSNNRNLLTGITDENGVQYAKWDYDSQGLAISSEHANGTERVSLSYNRDGTTTVTNEYGRNSTYQFQTINGIKQITSIEGEATSNCPYSNSKFTYNSRGLLESKIDAKNNLTTYDYNTRGLEVSRTEASGTPEARTITTEWHPTLYLKTKVTEPNRITTYQYDAQGRPLGQTVTPR